MFTVRIGCEAEQQDALVADLHEAGTLGVLQEDSELVAWFADFDTAAQFGTPEAAPSEDWSTAWQENWQPRLVGERFYLTPAWLTEPTPEGRLRLEYQPGMACGTGEHPGTRLAMMGLEAAVRAGDRVLDVGCGSGILCAATGLLGARAIGCDIEEADVRVAREHIPVDYFVGSARAVKAASVDVVTANINAEVLVTLAQDLLRVTRRAVILSGFRPSSVARLEAVFGPGRQFDLEGWSALLIQKVE